MDRIPTSFWNVCTESTAEPLQRISLNLGHLFKLEHYTVGPFNLNIKDTQGSAFVNEVSSYIAQYIHHSQYEGHIVVYLVV